MGLPARQRRVLDDIEGTLRGSDPKLAALYATFARLTRDEEMPRIEQLRHTAVRLSLRLRLGLTGFLGRVFGRLIPRQRAVLFFPLAIVLASVGIFFAARATSESGCPQAPKVAAGSVHEPTSKTCKNQYMLTPFLGRLIRALSTGWLPARDAGSGQRRWRPRGLVPHTLSAA